MAKSMVFLMAFLTPIPYVCHISANSRHPVVCVLKMSTRLYCTVYHMLRYVKPTPFILFTEFLYTRIKVESHPDLHHWFPFHRPLDTEFDTFVCASLSYVSTKPAAMHSRV